VNQVLAIDPGPEKSAWVMLKVGDPPIPQCMNIEDNDKIESFIDASGYSVPDTVMVIEWMDSYGMPVGKSVFETLYWIGRFCSVWESRIGYAFRITRREIKLHLCHTSRAKDANVRQVLIDRYGGTKQIAVGTKKAPGPLYGFKTHLWSALAVGITYIEKHQAAEMAGS